MTPFDQSPAMRAILRWVPVAALVPATIGVTMAIGFPRLGQTSLLILMGSFLLASGLPIIGPLKPGRRVVDEFDRMMQTRAYLAGFSFATFAALIGIVFILALAMAGSWDARTILIALGALLNYMLVIQLAVPSFVIATTAPQAEDD